MSAPDAPALRPDGTLKEALELEWIYSPSAENKSLPPTLTNPVVNDIDGGAVCLVFRDDRRSQVSLLAYLLQSHASI